MSMIACRMCLIFQQWMTGFKDDNVRKIKTWLRAYSPAGNYHESFSLSFTRLLTLKFLCHVSSSSFGLQSPTACDLVVSACIQRPWQSPSCAWLIHCMSPRRVSRFRGKLWELHVFLHKWDLKCAFLGFTNILINIANSQSAINESN